MISFLNEHKIANALSEFTKELPVPGFWANYRLHVLYRPVKYGRRRLANDLPACLHFWGICSLVGSI